MPVTGAIPGAGVWTGIALMAVGLVVGLSAGTRAETEDMREFSTKIPA
jgi:hypothetical protein